MRQQCHSSSEEMDLRDRKNSNEAIKRPSTVSRAGIRGEVREAFTLGKNI